MSVAGSKLPLVLQAAGWFIWLAGGFFAWGVSAAGLMVALAGLGWMAVLFWRLIAASMAQDRLHARIIGVAMIVGWLSLAGSLLTLLLDAPEWARAFILTGLWGFVGVTFVTVAHRMIPFFTSSAVPMVSVWRPFWVLWALLGAAIFQVLAIWVESQVLPGSDAGRAWMLLRGVFELAAGGVVLWLAVAWGLVQSLKIRLLAMLHIGFVWLGLAFVLGGASQLLGWSLGQPAQSEKWLLNPFGITPYFSVAVFIQKLLSA